MKKVLLIAVFLLMILIPLNVDANWNLQYGQNNRGQTIVRVVNHHPSYAMSCYFRDAFSYYTFVVPPRAYSGWFLPAGQFTIDCR